MNNRQNGRRRGRGGQQPRNGAPGAPDRGNRIDNRARGNAAQLLEKYRNLARDAQTSGDRVNTEYYLQFADHYFRVLSENRSRFEEQRPRRDDYRDDFMGEDDGAEPSRIPAGSDLQADADDWDREDERVVEAGSPALPEQVSSTAQQNGMEGERGYPGARSDRAAEERRPRRGRPPRAAAAEAPSAEPVAAGEQIDGDRLPQSLTSSPVEASEGSAGAPRPRRRSPRRPAAEANVEA